MDSVSTAWLPVSWSYARRTGSLGTVSSISTAFLCACLTCGAFPDWLTAGSFWREEHTWETQRISASTGSRC